MVKKRLCLNLRLHKPPDLTDFNKIILVEVAFQRIRPSSSVSKKWSKAPKRDLSWPGTGSIRAVSGKYLQSGAWSGTHSAHKKNHDGTILNQLLEPFHSGRSWYLIRPPQRGGDAKVKLVGLRPAENWRGVNCPHEALRAALFFWVGRGAD